MIVSRWGGSGRGRAANLGPPRLSTRVNGRVPCSGHERGVVTAQQAGRAAAAMVEAIADELSDIEASLAWLFEDADHFG